MKQRSRTDVLDCSRWANALFWGVIGVMLALMAHLLQAPPNLASLLRVGSSNPMFAQIEQELGPVLPSDPVGHDGQIYYLLARDPFARGQIPAALAAFDQNPPPYRYRRILFPLIAGGFGQFAPRVTLWGMLFCTVVGMGLFSIGVADIVHGLNLPRAAALPSIANVGALLSVMLVTADVMALGLATLGVALAIRCRFGFALLALALASLTKESYWLVALGLAGWLWRDNRSRATMLPLVSAVPLACWSLWLWLTLPDGVTKAANLGAPFAGLTISLTSWMANGLDGVQAAFAVYAVGSAILALVMVGFGSNKMLRWLAAPWLALACFAGVSVWIFPSNAARSFPILWPLGLLLLFEWASSGSSPRGIGRQR